MSDLISRSELLKALNNKNVQITFDLPVEEVLGEDVDLDDFAMLVQDAVQAYRKMVIDIIKKQPTAYSIDKVVEELETNKQNALEVEESIKEYNVWNEAIEIVQKVAEEYNGGWIPCSERLPEEPFGCLVTVIDCEPVTQNEFANILPYFVGYDGESWNDADGEEIPFEVIAWQPLPEPPKENE